MCAQLQGNSVVKSDATASIAEPINGSHIPICLAHSLPLQLQRLCVQETWVTELGRCMFSRGSGCWSIQWSLNHLMRADFLLKTGLC